jgi:hypothetical protein
LAGGVFVEQLYLNIGSVDDIFEVLFDGISVIVFICEIFIFYQCFFVRVLFDPFQKELKKIVLLLLQIVERGQTLLRIRLGQGKQLFVVMFFDVLFLIVKLQLPVIQHHRLLLRYVLYGAQELDILLHQMQVLLSNRPVAFTQLATHVLQLLYTFPQDSKIVHTGPTEHFLLAVLFLEVLAGLS